MDLGESAVLFRILLLFTIPTLSDDVYRYLWDGYVATEGVSPYAFAIDAPELDDSDSPQRDLANNRSMASPYLPTAQWVFFGTAFLFPLQPIFLQLVMVVFDSLSAWIIAKLLALAVLPAHHLLLYLWNPLVVVEVAHGAHVDVWMVLLTMTAVYLTLAPKYAHNAKGTLGAPCFGTGNPDENITDFNSPCLVLALDVAAVYGLWRGCHCFADSIRLACGVGFDGGVGWTGLFGALRIYGGRWKFNSGIFHWLESGLGAMGLSDLSSTTIAKGVSLVVMLGVLVLVWMLARRFDNTRAILRLTAVPFIAYLLLTPTVHPWYSLILLAFVPFLAPEKAEPRWLWWAVVPWLYLSGALIFSYIAYIDPLNFSEYEWVRLLEWLPVFLFLLLFFRACKLWLFGNLWVFRKT